MDTFVAITGEPESSAAEWLKLYNNDPEKAINAFLDDPGLLERKKQSNTYDESQFHPDSTGQQLSYPVHHQDTLNPNVFNDTPLAPTRPPSRVSTAHDGRYGGYNGQLSIQDREQQDLQEAMALSTSQTLPAQKNGVTAADQAHFGPATREHHDTKNWQMTVSKATAREIPLDPEPQDRRRPQATPAFLKPISHGNRLPGLLKILHSIPAAREALLSRTCIQSDYGSDSEWWNGVPIEYPHTVYEGAGPVASDKDIIHEAQRLMAFLDKTDRAYGSSDVLSTLPGLREHQEDPVINRFLGEWQKAANHHDPGAPLNDIFTTFGVRFDGESKQTAPGTQILELEVKQDSFVTGQSLYEIIDSTLWPSRDGTEVEGQVFLDKVADVLVIRICRGDGLTEGLDVKVPPIWYADRYGQAAQPQVHKMFAAKTAAEAEIEKLDARKARISQFRNSNHSGHTCTLFDGAKQYFEKTVQYLEGTEATPVRTKSTQRYNKIIDELAKISDEVANKLQELEESKCQVQARLRDLSKLLTEPSDIPEESPRERYTLRGVCAEPHTVYVQERTELETADDMLSGNAEDWQWWKCHYESNQTTSISCTKVRQIEVLKAVRDESPSAILVYASDRAMSVEFTELPPELESFVRNDNSLFAAELASSPGLSSTTMDQNNADLLPQQKMAKLDNTNLRSPRRDQSRSNDLSTDSSLPSYSSQAVFSCPPRRDASYDDFIPASLRRSSLDNDMDMDEGVEMMERDDRGGQGRGAFGATTYGGGSGGGGIAEGKRYQLGSYEPEIDMEEREDEVRQRNVVDW